MDRPWEACAGFFSGTEFLGVVWASTEDIAYQLALAEYGEQTDTDGSSCLYVRESPPHRMEKYYEEAGKKLSVSEKIRQSKLKLATQTTPNPVGLDALKRVHRRVQRARQKLQRTCQKASPNVTPINHKEASVYSIIEKWLKDEIDLICKSNP